MKLRYLMAVSIAGLFFFAGCAEKEEAVAFVGRRRITISDFKERLEDLPPYYRGFVSTEGGKKQYLSGVIKEEMLLQKAQDKNIHKIPEIARRLEEVRREVLLIAVIGYLQNEVVKVSDQDIRDYYELNLENFSDPLQLKVSHILLSDEETATNMLAQIRRGVSFEKLARENSLDTFTAVNGGDMGFIERGDMPEEFEEAAFSIERVGGISEIIRTSYGYHIIKLTGRKRGRAENLEEASEKIRHRIEQEKFNELLERYNREYNVRINYDVLDKIDLGTAGYEFPEMDD